LPNWLPNCDLAISTKKSGNALPPKRRLRGEKMAFADVLQTYRERLNGDQSPKE
jgi:hypothetical protein